MALIIMSISSFYRKLELSSPFLKEVYGYTVVMLILFCQFGSLFRV